MHETEQRFLHILAKLDFPQNWIDLMRHSVMGELSGTEKGGITLYGMEKLLLKRTGLAFVAKEYDDEDFWPLRFVEKFPGFRLILRLGSPDPSEWHTHKVCFGLEMVTPQSRYGGGLYELSRTILEQKDIYTGPLSVLHQDESEEAGLYLNRPPVFSCSEGDVFPLTIIHKDDPAFVFPPKIFCFHDEPHLLQAIDWLMTFYQDFRQQALQQDWT